MSPKQLQAEIEAAKIHQEAADRMAKIRRDRNLALKKQRDGWWVGPQKKTVRRPAGGVS